MKAFELFRPTDLFQAFSQLEKNPEETMVKSGGTDLLIWIKKALVAPKVIVDVTTIEELNLIDYDAKKGFFIGTNVNLNRIIEDRRIAKLYPALIEACKAHSDPIVRNKATLVGNVCSAVPSADTIPPLLCYEAQPVVQSSISKRYLPLNQFLLGPRKKDCQPTEIVTHIWLPLPPTEEGYGTYLRASRRNALDLAQAGVACTVFCKEGKGVKFYAPTFRIAFGALSPIPMRVPEAEKVLNEADTIDASTIETVVSICLAAIKPISDVRASKEYRLGITASLIRAALRYCLQKSTGKTPEHPDQEGCDR